MAYTILAAVALVLKAGVHRMTSPYGPRIDPISGKAGIMHYGNDYTGTNGQGDNIIAFADGLVTYARDTVKGYSPIFSQAGNYVIIKHSNGYQSRYCHMAYGSIKIKKGDSVKRGDVIGYMGTTGKSTGVHLHFALQKNDMYIDPQPYIIGTMSIAPQMGDVDGDGVITAKDRLKTVWHFMGKKKLTDSEFARADMDGDGKITSKDVLRIVRLFYKK